MTALWNKISNLGIATDTESRLQKRIRLTNQVTASLSFIAFCYIFVFYFFGLKKEALGAVIIVAGILMSLLMNYRGLYLLSRVWMLIVANGAVFTYSYFLGYASGMPLLFFSFSCLPWIFFELRNRLHIAGGVLMAVACYYIYDASDPAPTSGIEPAVQHIIYLSLIVVQFVILCICMFFFANQNTRAEQRLTDVNTSLREQKEELQCQQEELAQINEELNQQTESLKISEEELRVQEEELRQINAELEERTEAVDFARRALLQKSEELEQISRYKSEFLANMSHELRTPLNSILILANLLRENKQLNLTEKQVEYAGIIQKSGADLLNLINDILDLSKIEAGKIEINIEKVPVKDIIRDMKELFSVMAAQKGISFVIEPEDTVPFLDTDKHRVCQIIKNLLSNSFKFTPGGGKITLGFRAEGDYYYISVADTGIGISPEKQQLIFEAFQQGDGSTSRRYGGTGLGLSISKELARKLKGALTLQSRPGQGSTFTLLLPLKAGATLPALQTEIQHRHISEIPQPAGMAAEPVSVTDDKRALRPGEQCILIIEDDPVFASVVRDFAHSKGYKAVIALRGDEGLEYAKEYMPAAIILDLNLPVMDGKSVLKILKSEEGLRHIPVHVISAEDYPGPSPDVESYWQKPLELQDLESAFSHIRIQDMAGAKRVLILSENNRISERTLEASTGEGTAAIACDTVATAGEALRQLQAQQYDCIIADIGSDVRQCFPVLEQMRDAAGADTHIIVYLDNDISTADEIQLKKYAGSIIRKSSSATDRLLDEVELFLHKIKTAGARHISYRHDQTADKTLRGKKVLLVDDDMRNVFALNALLEEQGMKTVTAENGKEALEQLAQHPDVDIVLMDIMMPEMDGYEAMQHIRADKQHARLPVIALTAKAMADDRKKCIEAGASDYITKPVDGNKLCSLMRVWLS